MIAMLWEHLVDIMLVVALLWLSAAVGVLVLRRIDPVIRTALENLLFGTAIGLGVIATCLLLLGLFGGFRRPALMALFAGLVFVARKPLVRMPSLLARAASDVRERWCGGSVAAVAALTVATVGLFLLLLSLQPPADWDSLMYHLTVPAQFLERGRIFLPDDNLHASRVGLIHMLYVPLLATGSSSAPQVLNTCLALLLGLSAFSFSARFLGTRTATASLAALWGSTTIPLVAITARVDVSLAFFVFLAHYLLVAVLMEAGQETSPSSDGRASVPSLLLVAVLLGFAFGVKYHGAAYAAALMPATLVGAANRKTNGGPVVPLLLFALVLAAAALPWLIKNWLLVRAPLYPFLAQPILPPWLAELYGSSEFPTAVDRDILGFIWELGTAFNLRDFFLHPERLTIEGEGRFYWGNPFLLLFPLGLFSFRDRAVAWLVAPAALYVIVVLVPFPGTNLRYLIPALIPLTIVAAHGTMEVLDRVASARSNLFAAGFLVLALIPSMKTMYFWMFQTDAVPHLVGVASREQYLRSHPDGGTSAYAPVVRDLNERLENDDRILMLFDARGFYFEPDVIQDNKASNWLFLSSGPAQNSCLSDSGITHVLLNLGVLNYYLRAGMQPELHNLGAFPDFAARCLTQEYSRAGFVLYQVNGHDPPRGAATPLE